MRALVCAVLILATLGCSASDAPTTAVPTTERVTLEPSPTPAQGQRARRLADTRSPGGHNAGRPSSPPEPRTIEQPPSARDADDIRELVLRDVIGPRPRVSRVLFLSVDDDNDPTDTFLARLRDLWATIRVGSRAEHVEPTVARPLTYRDRLTGEPGIYASVSKLRWADNSRVEADGVVDGSRRYGIRNTYDIGRSGQRWKILGIKSSLVK
jgi:hypothetical protein